MFLIYKEREHCRDSFWKNTTIHVSIHIQYQFMICINEIPTLQLVVRRSTSTRTRITCSWWGRRKEKSMFAPRHTPAPFWIRTMLITWRSTEWRGTSTIPASSSHVALTGPWNSGTGITAKSRRWILFEQSVLERLERNQSVPPLLITGTCGVKCSFCDYGKLTIHRC